LRCVHGRVSCINHRACCRGRISDPHDFACDILQDVGYAIETAANADDAIAAIEANPLIRIVFTDIHMPGSMDGMKLAHYIRGRWPPIKLIVTSGYPGPYRRPPPGALFLPKPYGANALTDMLRRLAADLTA
jgi:CheY-like chemotaxis protein